MAYKTEWSTKQLLIIQRSLLKKNIYHRDKNARELRLASRHKQLQG